MCVTISGFNETSGCKNVAFKVTRVCFLTTKVCIDSGSFKRDKGVCVNINGAFLE